MNVQSVVDYYRLVTLAIEHKLTIEPKYEFTIEPRDLLKQGIEAIGNIGGAIAVEVLEEILSTSVSRESKDLAAETLRALGNTNHPKAATVLRNYLSNCADKELRKIANQALEAVADDLR